jgi:hypothetical protein
LALQQESDARSRKKSRRKVEVGSGYVGRLDSAGCLVPGGFGGEHTWRVLEKGMKAVVSKQQACRASLGVNPAKEPEAEPRALVQTVHQSHQQTVTDAHTKLGLPSSAIGKTLMPFQIIQLRARRLSRYCSYYHHYQKKKCFVCSFL